MRVYQDGRGLPAYEIQLRLFGVPALYGTLPRFARVAPSRGSLVGWDELFELAVQLHMFWEGRSVPPGVTDALGWARKTLPGRPVIELTQEQSR